MTCDLCLDFYFVASRVPRVCRDCEGKMIQQAAKEKDEKALNIAQIAQWVLTGERPRSYRRAWFVW